MFLNNIGVVQISYSENRKEIFFLSASNYTVFDIPSEKHITIDLSKLDIHLSFAKTF